MGVPQLDLDSLSVDERLHLLEQVWALACMGVAHAVITHSLMLFGIALVGSAIGILTSRLSLELARSVVPDELGGSAPVAGPA